MFDSIETIVIMNIQSHVKTILNLNKTGLHRISGNNSHGKSVIYKALDALFFGEHLTRDGRQALIRDGHEFGIISAKSYNGIILTLYLHEESSRTFYELTIGENKIRKFISDDYQTLLKVANFHYMKEEKFSLNRYKTKTTLPFTHTSGTFNYKVLDSASELPEYNKLVTNLNEALTTIKEDKLVTERKIFSLTEQLKLIDDTGIDELQRSLLYVESLRKQYLELKPLTESLNSIYKVQEQLQQIILNDFKFYEQPKRQLDFVFSSLSKIRDIINNEIQIKQFKESSSKKPVSLDKLFKQVNIINNLITVVGKIETINKMSEDNKVIKIIDLSKTFDNIKYISNLTLKINELFENQKQLENIEIIEYKNLKIMFDNINIINNIGKITDNLKIINKQLTSNKVNKPQDMIKNLNQLRVLNKLQQQTNLMINNNKKQTQLDETLTNLELELQSLIDQIGICKYCGGKLTKDHYQKHSKQLKEDNVI